MFDSILEYIVMAVALSTFVQAFSEDVCFNQTNGNPVECLPQVEECPFEEASLECRAYALNWANGINSSNPPGRSMIHVDSTYYIAQSLGYDPQFAYFLAASVEVVDLTVYKPVDKCGNQMDIDRLATVRLNGFQRQTYCTGGLFYHWPFPYIGNLSNPDFSRQQLRAIREWGMGMTEELCVGGWTEPTDGNYFDGAKCYCNGLNTTKCVALLLNSTFASVDPPGPTELPQLQYRAITGQQVINFDDDEGQCQRLGLNQLDQCTCVKNPVYAHEIDEYVESTAKREGVFQFEDGTIPVEAAKLGVWLHSMQDSFSHYQCIQGSTFATSPDEEGVMQNKQDNTECAQPLHALRHYWEVGFDQSPPQVPAALEETYDQLLAWKMANEVEYPQYFVADFESIDKFEVVTDVLSALHVVSAPDRIDAFVHLSERRGWKPMPGLGASYECEPASYEPSRRTVTEEDGPESPSASPRTPPLSRSTEPTMNR